jgi:serine/threonine protein kinase/Tol biopolymer transport system component
MTGTARWKEISALYAAALERPETERASFVTRACAGDEELRQQLESLLAYHDEAQQTLNAPAAEVLARTLAVETASLVGRQLGAYRIDAPLASGGMGEVYRATDVRLHRTVALKILPSQAADDPASRQRFEREAQAIAGLRHPHICVLHDIGHADGIDFLVLELIDGETLADRLRQGPLPLDVAIRCAIEIAEALIAIHRQGIVHRDLKPGNVMLTDSGAKLLDFGLAKVHDSSLPVLNGGAAAEARLTLGSSTAAGTLPYMTPEQLDRMEIDHRSDVFAFGAVLYEMVTGRRAFDAASADDVVTAIREHDPPPLPAAVVRRAPGLPMLLEACLQKAPSARWSTSSDLADALRALHSSIERQERSPRTLAAVAFAAAAVVVGSAYWVMRSNNDPIVAPSAASPPALVLDNARPVTAADAIEFDPSLSPRGDLVAYSAGVGSDFRLVVRSVRSRELVSIPVTGAQQFQPRWSPDGRRLLYITRDGVFVSSLAGDVPAPIARVAAVPANYATVMPEGHWITAATWSPTGHEIAVAHGGALFAVNVTRGSYRPLTTAREEFHWCDWSADGKWIACTLGNPHLGLRQQFGNLAPSAIVVLPAAGGPLREVAPRTAMNQSPVWSADSRRLYFVSNRQGTSDIYGIDIGDDGAPRGEVARLTTGLNAYSISLAPDRKTLAYTTFLPRANIWSLPIPTDGAPIDIGKATRVTTGNQVIEAMQITGQGKWLLYDSTVYGNADIFRVPVDGGTPERLTTDAADDFAPAVSPDGRLLAFHSWRTKRRDVFVQPIDGGPAQLLTTSPASGGGIPSWLGDGAVVYPDYRVDNGVNQGGLFIVRRNNAGGWSPPERLDLPGLPGPPAITRDGRFVYPQIGDIDIARAGDGAARRIYTRSSPDLPMPERVALDERDTTVFFKAHDAEGRAEFWSVPIAGGPATLLVRFNDSARPSPRWDFAVGGGRLYFAIDERRSNIWIADVTER